MSVDFPQVGTSLAEYELEAVLAEGGFSRVYRSTDPSDGRAVAIKVLRPSPKRAATWAEGEFERLAERFVRAEAILRQLSSPHTVRVFDHGVSDGLIYTVMEFVEGQTVSEWIADHGALAPAEAVEIVQQVLDALVEAHELGVLHRDLKPSNLMLAPSPDGVHHVKVLDFGLAKGMQGDTDHGADLTTEGSVIGTPRYMSPEQIEGHSLGPPTDIYSLGLVLYEMLSGIQAVSADSTLEIIARHVSSHGFQVPPGLQLTPRLRRVLMKMVEKNPDHRYQTALDVLEDLRDWRSGDAVVGLGESTAVQDEVPQPSTPAPEPPSPASSRRTQRLIGVGLVVVVVALVALYLSLQ